MRKVANLATELMLASLFFWCTLTIFNMATDTLIIKVEPFDPDLEKWESYEERTIQFFLANDVTEDKKKVAVLLSSMGPKGYGLLKSLTTPTKPSTLTFPDICKRLHDYYNPKPPVLLERFRFYNQIQGPSEKIAEYLAELRRLSSTCNFGGFLNEALRDKFVCGLFDTAIQKKLLSEDDSLTLDKAVKTPMSMESANKNAAITKGETHSVQRVSPTSSSLNASKLQCSCCGKNGHIKKDCCMKSFKCFNCGRIGHLQNVCRDKPATEQSNVQEKTSKYKFSYRKNRKSSKVKQVREVDGAECNTDSDESDSGNEITVYYVNSLGSDKAFKVDVEIENQKCQWKSILGQAYRLSRTRRMLNR
ncbi:hypothetical protein HOLleu_44666 [Holothuria leucospilota]|uniref:CCHC-type domain-containing protein n=1 Tax=Holothuria leucospilota TaxID=206669 RepID=A0A9Q0YAI1_HOLLE|nr:hypothetical protein HOLleu_44666 [Holothuria leucospilota]